MTNLDTGYQVLVRVNDRGPADPGRVIALSPRAMTLLHAADPTAVRVRVEVMQAESLQLASDLGGAESPHLALAVVPLGDVAAQALPPPPGATQAPHVREVATAPAAPHTSTPTVSPVPLRLPETVTRVAPRPGSLYIELASFGHADDAVLLQRRLARLGAEVALDYTAPPRTAYRVRIGPLADAARRRCDARTRDRGAVGRRRVSSRPSLPRRAIRSLAVLTRRVLLVLSRRPSPASSPRRSRRPSSSEPGGGKPATKAMPATAGTHHAGADAGRPGRYRGALGDHHRLQHRRHPARQGRRRADAAVVDDQADDGLYRLRDAEVRPAEARPGIAGQRARLAHGRLEDVRPDRHAGEGRGPDPRHDRAVGQRRLHRAGRGHRRVGGAVRRSDEPEGQGARPDAEPFPQRDRLARPGPPHVGARHRHGGAPT